MTIRAKFTVQSIVRTTYGHTIITLFPVSSGSEENKAFFNATPNGRIELNTINDAAMEAFGNAGDEFYVDFTPSQQPQ